MDLPFFLSSLLCTSVISSFDLHRMPLKIEIKLPEIFSYILFIQIIISILFIQIINLSILFLFQNNYIVLKELDIKERQEDDITSVSSVLSISRAASSILLHYYNWYFFFLLVSVV